MSSKATKPVYAGSSVTERAKLDALMIALCGYWVPTLLNRTGAFSPADIEQHFPSTL